MMDSFNWSEAAKLKWDAFADEWSSRSKNMWDNGSRKDIVPFIEKHLQKGKTIIDVGCGDGYGSYKLYKLGYEVTGIDISDEMVLLAKEKWNETPIAFFEGDVNQLPFENKQYDSLMAINVIEWVEHVPTALREIHRVLTVGGLACIGILGPTAGPRANSYHRLHGEKTILNTMMPWEFQQLATELGFERVDQLNVYREGVKPRHYEGLPMELKQSLTFMSLFMLQKVGE